MVMASGFWLLVMVMTSGDGDGDDDGDGDGPKAGLHAGGPQSTQRPKEMVPWTPSSVTLQDIVVGLPQFFEVYYIYIHCIYTHTHINTLSQSFTLSVIVTHSSHSRTLLSTEIFMKASTS